MPVQVYKSEELYLSLQLCKRAPILVQMVTWSTLLSATEEIIDQMNILPQALPPEQRALHSATKSSSCYLTIQPHQLSLTLWFPLPIFFLRSLHK